MIMIGSRALLFRLVQTEEVKQRQEKADYDVIMTLDEFLKWHELYEDYIHSCHPTQGNKYKVIVIKDGVRKMYEIEIGLDVESQSTSAELLLDFKNKGIVTDGLVKGFFGEIYRTLKPSFQYLTKKSHIIYPVHFEKNIEDYHLLKRIMFSEEIDKEEVGLMDKYLELRSNEASDRYNQRTPKLNVTTEDFFSSKLPVPNYFVHDDIHEVMAHHEKPVFTMMQKDSSKAWCDKDMFFDLPYKLRVQAVQEEAYVIALERYIIPQYGDDWQDFFGAYKKAVKRICTTLTSGWFREFAIESYPDVISNYNPFFVREFYDAVNKGVIKPQIEDYPRLFN